ncbi:MAG: hypothetical protein IT385_12285 [Deltaproteobacteria bacterium]|nr:hypothetical protein [Deltaproteobacteria bacterium]
MRWLILVSLVTAGCGSKGDQASPRGVAEGLAAAMDRGDAELGQRLIAPENKLRDAFDCGSSDRLAHATARAREELRLAYEELRATGVRVRLARMDEPGSETTALAAGDVWRDCAARRAIEVHRARLTLVYRKGARDDEDQERWDFIRFGPDEPWWYVPK